MIKDIKFSSEEKNEEKELLNWFDDHILGHEGKIFHIPSIPAHIYDKLQKILLGKYEN